MAANTLKDKCALVGIGETEYLVDSDRDRTSLALEAIMKASDDAGVNVKDIDGIVRYNIDTSASDQILADNLGLNNLAFSAETPWMGGSGCMAVATAAAAIVAGLANYVVCYRAHSEFDFGDGARLSSSVIWARDAGINQFHRPFGFIAMMDVFALMLERHCHEYGTTAEQLGAIAVAARKHASMNPRAILRDEPLSLQDYLESPIYTGRLKKADISITSDGACAVIVTSAERAKELKHPPVYIMSAAGGVGPECPPFWEMWPLRSIPTDSAAKYVAPRLFEMAGITTKDIDVAEIYDCCTLNVLLQLEDYGFCKKGEAGSFVEGGHIEVGGELPIITSGGGLAEAGVHGFNHVLEGVRQIRRTSTAQVENAEIALVTSSSPIPTSALILRR
jgi:acetyl-CoA acetyltransferase